MGITIVDLMFLVVLAAIELWRRRLLRYEGVPRWLRYVSVAALLGVGVRWIAWQYCAHVLASMPMASLAEVQRLAPRFEAIFVVANGIAVASCVAALIVLLVATGRYRWWRRAAEPVTFGPYR